VGIQNKVLEAMACATPVVASQQAASALQAQAGIELLTAADPQEFAGVVLDLLADAPRRARIGLAGRRYVERCHNWTDIAACLETIYARAGQRV
jgi:glycosyltransferase involved in cell wall biosynthesis